MHSFFILCKKKNTKSKKQMFIFYVSLTLYKLLDNCQEENNGVFSDSCYFCNVSVCRTRRVAGKSKDVCALTKSLSVCSQRWCTVYRIFLYSSLGVLSGSRPKSQWDPWLSVGPPEADSGTRGSQWDL